MTQRKKKYGWLYHEEHEGWMPPDGMFLAEKDGRNWVVWRCDTPYKVGGAGLVAEGASSLSEAVDAADDDRRRYA
jgi:hypothetical protein